MSLEKDYNDLTIGDHLVTERGKYTHHGIYIGEGKVIHYAGLSEEGKKTGPIEEVSIYDFTSGQLCSVKEYKGLNDSITREKVVERAKKRLGESEYNILHNNCEHFAEWCWGNKLKSGQVTDILFSLSGLIPNLPGSPDDIIDTQKYLAAEKISNILSEKSMNNILGLKKPYFYIKQK